MNGVTLKRGIEVAVGDIVVFLGTPHRITDIVPYTHPSFPREAWAIAFDAFGWSITLVPNGYLPVVA